MLLLCWPGLVMIPGLRRRRRKGHFLARPFFLFLFEPENEAVLFPSLVSRLLHPAQILNMWMSKSDRCTFIPRPCGIRRKVAWVKG